MKLSEPQQRHLTATLRTVETWLAETEAIVRDPYQGIVYRIAPALTAEQRRMFLEQVATVRQQLARVAEQFALARGDQPEVQSLRARLSTMWQALEEARPKRISGYGALDPEAAQALDKHIDGLILEVERLHSVLQGDGTQPSATQEPAAWSGDTRGEQ